MSEEEFKNFTANQNGIILAWKEDDIIYPIFLNKNDASVLKLVLKSIDIQIMKHELSRFQHLTNNKKKIKKNENN